MARLEMFVGILCKSIKLGLCFLYLQCLALQQLIAALITNTKQAGAIKATANSGSTISPVSRGKS